MLLHSWKWEEGEGRKGGCALIPSSSSPDIEKGRCQLEYRVYADGIMNNRNEMATWKTTWHDGGDTVRPALRGPGM